MSITLKSYQAFCVSNANQNPFILNQLKNCPIRAYTCRLEIGENKSIIRFSQQFKRYQNMHIRFNGHVGTFTLTHSNFSLYETITP